MTTRLPLANLDKHGATLIDSDSGFSLQAPSGAKLGAFPYPPDPWLLEHDNPTSAPVSTWAAQKMLEVYAEFDAEQIKINRNDRLSTTARIQDLSALRKKAADAMANIETTFAAEEAAAQANEAKFYSFPTLKADDVIGALRDNEIRSGLRAMPQSELAEINRRLNAGEDRAILEAVLRSPLKMGRLEEFAQKGWRVLRDSENPQQRTALNLRAKYNDWGRRIVGAVQGALATKLRGA